MKWFGSISELVSLVFRKNSQAITLRPNQSVTYTASRDIQTPAQDAASVLTSRDSTDTLTNKSISGSTNTLTNIPAGTALTGQVPTANGGTGVNSTATFPTSGIVVTEAAVETLTNKTIDGDSNTVQDLPDTALKTNLTNASKFFTRDASGIPESATKAVPAGTVVGTTDSQTLTNKTLTSPAITTPTGIVKGDVGLGNVDNTSDATKNSATATLTNKTLTGAVVSDYVELDTQGSDPSSPAGAGDVRVYAKSKFLYTKDSDGVVTQVGAGSGGRNYLAQDFFGNSVGTVGSGNVSDTGNRSTGTMTDWQSTNTANISISSSTSSPLRETGSFLTTGTSSNAAGTTFIESKGFNLDSVDLGKAVAISFDVGDSTLGTDWDVCVVRYNSSGTFQEKISVAGTASTGTPASAQLPTGTTTFRGFFISSSTQTDYYAIRWRRLANSVNVKLDSLFVGPQSLSLSFGGTDWISYTPTTAGLGTPSATSVYYRRVGDSIEVHGFIDAGTTTATALKIGLPTGLSIDSAKLPGSLKNYLGMGTVSTAVAVGAYTLTAGLVMLYDSTDATAIFAATQNGTDASGNTYGALQNGSAVAGTGSQLSFSIKAPIVGWSSNITSADRAVEEYAFNTSTSTSASDTTSFGYGSQGAQIQSITAALSRRVRFSTPILSTDTLVAELSFDRVKWVAMSGGAVELNATQVHGWTFQGSAYGFGKTYIVNSTDVDVFFGTYRLPTSTYGGTGSPWSDVGTYYWRVRKVAGGAAVGFPVQSSNIIGRIDGNSAATGFVGEYQEQASTADYSITTSYVNVTGMTLTLGPGRWLIGYDLSVQMDGGNSMNAALFDGSTQSALKAIVLNSTSVIPMSMQKPVTLTAASTTYTVQARASSAGISQIIQQNSSAGLSGNDTSSTIWAYRIA